MHVSHVRLVSTLIAVASAIALTGQLALAADARARQIPVLVVAENHDKQHEFALTPGQPMSSFVVDAGGHIAGDPVAGDARLDAVRVALGMSAALQGNYAFSQSADRKLDIVYHWGLIRPARSELPSATQLDPNLRARLLLVERPERVADMEKASVHRHAAGASLSSIPQADMWADAYARADDARYYVIVTAYDHEAQKRGEVRMVWRTRLSTPEKSGPMNEVLATLARASRDFLASDRTSPKTFRVALESAPATVAEQTRHPFLQTRATDAAAVAPTLSAVIQQDQRSFAGQ